MNFIYDRCPICDRIGKSLACSECRKNNKKSFLVLQSGELYNHSPKTTSLMFIPKVLEERLSQFHDCVEEHNNSRLRVMHQLDRLSLQTKLKSEISSYAKYITKLKGTLANQRLEVEHQKHILSENRKLNSDSQKRINRTAQKKAKLKEYIRNKQNSVFSSNKKIKSLNEDLIHRKKEHVMMLTLYIFPIKNMKLDENGLYLSTESENVLSATGEGAAVTKERSSMQMELHEAQQLSFVDGRWVDQKLNVQALFGDQAATSSLFNIFLAKIMYGDFDRISVGHREASAPLGGDYSLYVEWLETNHKSSGTDPPPSGGSASMSGSSNLTGYHEPTQRSVLRIGVALCHAAQMLLVMRKILGIHLPHKINYRTFCNPTISPHQFVNTVKLLNSNLLSMCLLQGVDGAALHPLKTLVNLQILTDKLLKDGERRDPCLPCPKLLDSMENTLGLADVSDDDSDPDAESSDWELSFDAEWEAVPISEYKSALPASAAYTSTNTQSSILSQPTGLVTSALNWATKGWWGPPNE